MRFRRVEIRCLDHRCIEPRPRRQGGHRFACGKTRICPHRRQFRLSFFSVGSTDAGHAQTTIGDRRAGKPPEPVQQRSEVERRHEQLNAVAASMIPAVKPSRTSTPRGEGFLTTRREEPADRAGETCSKDPDDGGAAHRALGRRLVREHVGDREPVGLAYAGDDARARSSAIRRGGSGAESTSPVSPLICCVRVNRAALAGAPRARSGA
jgi:hypothetical protein